MGGPSTPRIPRLLSLRAVAELTTIPRSTLYTLVANGELPGLSVSEMETGAESALERIVSANGSTNGRSGHRETIARRSPHARGWPHRRGCYYGRPGYHPMA